MLGNMRWLPKSLARLPALLKSVAGNSAPNLRRLSKLLGSSGLSAQQAAIHSHFWTEPDDARGLFAPGILPRVHAPYKLFEGLLHEAPFEKKPVAANVALGTAHVSAAS